MGLLPVCGEALRAAELADRRASARRLAEARLVEIHVVQVQLQRLVVQLDQLPQCDPVTHAARHACDAAKSRPNQTRNHRRALRDARIALVCDSIPRTGRRGCGGGWT